MSYTFSEEIIDEVREQNDIVDVIAEYITLKRTGSNYKGLCPFHHEKTPSFVVSSTKQIFHCFGCGEGGNVISFIMKHHNLGFVEALELLADRAHIVLEKEVSMVDEKIQKKRNTLYEINREAARFFYKSLFNNRMAYRYLMDRGMDKPTIKTFGLGYAPDGWENLAKYLAIKGYEAKDIEEAGLIIKRKEKTGHFDRFRNRIMFPIINTKGNIIGFGGRVFDDSQPKYLNSPDTPIFNKGRNLYGLNIIKKQSRNKEILLVEGYMDVISLHRHGIQSGVASLGTALTPEQAKLIKRYGQEIYIGYDSDKAGQNATDKALEILRKEGVEPKVVIMPQGKDPDDYIKKHSKEAFRNLIKKALPYIDYKIYRYREKYDLRSVEGQIQFTQQIATILKSLKSAIEKDAYIQKIAQESGISIEAIKNEVYGYSKGYTGKSRSKDKYTNGNYRNNNKEKIAPVKYSQEPGHLTAERNLINLIIKDKTIFNKVKETFQPEDFLNDVYRQIAEKAYEIFEMGQTISLEDFKTIFDNRDFKKVEEVFNIDSQFEGKDKQKAVEDYIQTINYYKLKLTKKEIITNLQVLESKQDKTEGDVRKFNELCAQLMTIEKQLKLHQ